MILIEENFNNIEAIAESTGSGKTYLSGIFGEAEEKNRNGRIYDLSEMKEAVRQINERAQSGNAILGELDHPSNLDIKLANVSHRLVEADMRGNKLYAKAEILENHPNGQILKGLIKDNVRVGVSTRGGGQVNPNNGRVKNFSLVTIDAVATPSCRSAYPETIQEQLQMYGRGEIVTDLAEAVIHDPLAQRYFQLELRKFISQLGK